MESMLFDVLQILKISCSGLIAFLVIREKVSAREIIRRPVAVRVGRCLMVGLMLASQGLGIFLFMADRDSRRSMGRFSRPLAGAGGAAGKVDAEYPANARRAGGSRAFRCCRIRPVKMGDR